MSSHLEVVDLMNRNAELVKTLERLVMTDDSEEFDDNCELCDGCGEVSAITTRSDRDQIGCPACIDRANSRSARAALAYKKEA